MSLPVWLWGLCLLSCGFAVLSAHTDRFVWAFFSALLAVGSAFAALRSACALNSCGRSALCAAFGVGEPRGKIPVRLPEAGLPLPSGEAGQP